MDNSNIDIVMEILEKESKKWDVPVVTLIALQEKNPFKVLISTILSLRTKDEVTIITSKKIYKILTKPSDIYNLSDKQIEEAIYPSAFYKRKTIQIRKICERLDEEFKGIVPNDLDILLTFAGVGRKTANLVLSEGFSIPAMCVDTHVHRISNRLGYIKSKTADESEIQLRKKLPVKHWIQYNTLLVAFGQSLCRPISPHCTKCPIIKYCKRVNVDKHR
jgi:endonuclease-3